MAGKETVSFSQGADFMAQPRTITVKGLSKTEYEVIHKLPRGLRGAAVRALLRMASRTAKHRSNWYLSAIDDRFSLELLSE